MTDKEMNVNKIMKKIRHEVARRKKERNLPSVAIISEASLTPLSVNASPAAITSDTSLVSFGIKKTWIWSVHYGKS